MNVIYIHCHDAGRYLGPYLDWIDTPHLKAFAAEATVFHQAFCNAPTCSPSRAALLTGMTAHEAGMFGLVHRGFSLRDDEDHLACFLARQGYETALCGIQHEWDFRSEVPAPYERIIPQEGTEDRQDVTNDLRTARAAAQFLRQRQDMRPLFLSVGFFYPHRILPEPEDRFSPAAIDLPADYPDSPEVRKDFAAYKTAAWWMDQAFGEIWQALGESGLADNSLILFTTDHGIAFPRMKCTLSDRGTGVAFMMKAPGQKAKQSDALVSHLDFFPTVCDYTGLPSPRPFRGQSLRPLLEDHPGARGHEEVFAEVNYHVSYEPKRSLRTPTRKYIRNYHQAYFSHFPNIDPSPSKDALLENRLLHQNLPLEELYDLERDPGETRNLADDPAYFNDLCRLREGLEAWMKETNDPLLSGDVPEPPGANVDRGSAG